MKIGTTIIAGISACLLFAAPTTSGQRAAAPGSIKPPIRGLVSMGAYKFLGSGGDPVNTLEPLNQKPGLFGGLVIIATWKQLQPTPASVIADQNTIDRALADVREYNAKNPGKPLAVKLRVWGGIQAPEWAMQLGGPPIQTTHNDKARAIGRFWSPAYRQAWTKFQGMLAAKYDSRPLVREVSVTSCMTYTAEPFFLPTEPSVLGPLRAAGYQDAAHKDCLNHALDDYKPWKSTRIVLSVNPFYGSNGQGMGDPGFTERIMRSCRQSLGARCVFDNHDLDAAPPRSLLPLYDVMKELGPEIEFQTLHETPDDFDGTIKKGVALGASSIELWQDYQGFPLIPDARLRQWAAMLERNTRR